MKSAAETYRTGHFIIKQFFRRNKKYLKRTCSGKDLIIYCGHTEHRWSPVISGYGGSEEAVIHLSRELAKLGWNVTVYNNCGHSPVADIGVIYRPFWEFNPRDKQDVAILWHPSTTLLDLRINAERVFIDIHLIIPESTFTDGDRLNKIAGIFFKSQFHRSMYPSVPDDKVIVVPNGIDFAVLENGVEKDPFLLINTSSPDRSLSVLPGLFAQVKQRVPQARLQWAYGWNLFELYHRNDPLGLHWMQRTQDKVDEAGIETLGHLTLAEVGKLYRRGALLAYPTDFAEIDCISVRKAQACGCVPVTTDAGALAETVQFGVKVPCKQPAPPVRSDRFYYGIEDPDTQRRWVDAVVDLLNSPERCTELGKKGTQWARQFEWPQIAARWHEILQTESAINRHERPHFQHRTSCKE
jgi:glycosyltransferase involved in cell wall biosynthesis